MSEVILIQFRLVDNQVSGLLGAKRRHVWRHFHVQLPLRFYQVSENRLSVDPIFINHGIDILLYSIKVVELRICNPAITVMRVVGLHLNI